LLIEEQPVPFEFTSLTVDEDRHLKLVVYARQKRNQRLLISIQRGPVAFARWLKHG
jgi:hypothetical protein